MLSHFIPFKWPKSDIFGDGVFDKMWMAFEVARPPFCEGAFFPPLPSMVLLEGRNPENLWFLVVFGLFLPRWPAWAPRETIRVAQSYVGSSLAEACFGRGGYLLGGGDSCVRTGDLAGLWGSVSWGVVICWYGAGCRLSNLPLKWEKWGTQWHSKRMCDFGPWNLASTSLWKSSS